MEINGKNNEMQSVCKIGHPIVRHIVYDGQN